MPHKGTPTFSEPKLAKDRMRQLLDVMYQAVELPLRIDLLLPSEGEAVELLVVPDVAEHGFHRGKASPVSRLAFGAVDAGFHFVGEAGLSISFALKEADLPGLGLGWGAQALVAMTAWHAVLLCTLEFDGCKSIDDAVAAVAVKNFARRANAGVGGWVVVEVCGTINSGLPLLFLIA